MNRPAVMVVRPMVAGVVTGVGPSARKPDLLAELAGYLERVRTKWKIPGGVAAPVARSRQGRK